jgi:hypothetical protein
MYHHPDDGRFRYIPWGADDVFADPGPFITETVPASVKARNKLTARLYSIPETRDRYLARVQELLNTVWNESKMIAEMDEAAELFWEHLVVDRDYFSERLERNKSFIRNRRAAVEEELENGPPVWPTTALQKKKTKTLQARFDFESRWTARMPSIPAGHGDVSGSLTIDGRPVGMSRRGMMSGWVPEGFRSGHPFLVLAGYDNEENRWLAVTLIVDPFAYSAGETLPVDFFTVLGMLMEFPGESDELNFGRLDSGMKALGWGTGQLNLTQTGTNDGEPVSGSFEVSFRIK